MVFTGLAARAHVDRNRRRKCRGRCLSQVIQVALQGAADNRQCHIVDLDAGGILDGLEILQAELGCREHPVRAYRLVEAGFRRLHIDTGIVAGGHARRVACQPQGVARGAAHYAHHILDPVDCGA